MLTGGGDIPPKIFSGGDGPLNFQGGRKIGEKNKEKESKIKKSSKISQRQ